MKIGVAAVGGLAIGAAAAYVAKPSTTATSTSTQTQISTETGPTTTVTGSGVTSTVTGPTGTVTSTVTAPPSTVTSTATSTLTSTVTSTVTGPSGVLTAQENLDTLTAFLSLSTTEQTELTAIANAIIPTDSTGPGATTAGAVYFIDRQLRTTYGTSGLMYRKAPFIPANSQTAFTYNGVNYPGATVTFTAGGQSYTVTYTPTTNVRVGAGTRYQYPFDMKQFWTIGLAGIENYSNAAYGGSFETLSAANQTQVLTDLWNNKPTYNGTGGALSGGAPGGYQEVVENINSIASGVPGGTQFGPVLPSDFAYELFFMVWNGFWTDPIYGGNKGMVGWTYVGFRGANMGNFYGEGYTPEALMVLNKPVTLQPVSIGQYQKGSA